MNISLFSDWIEDGRFGESGLASMIADIVDEAMARGGPGEAGPSERVDEGLLQSAWQVAEHEDSVVRARTAVVLGRLGYERVAPTLHEALDCDEVEVARAAAIVLAGTNADDPRLNNMLIETLEDPAAARELRSAAAKAYASTGTPEAIDRLIEISQSEDGDFASYGIEGLGYTRPEPDSGRRQAVLDALIARLKSGDSALATSAAGALGDFGDPAAIHELEMILIEKDPSVRRRSLFALARLGAESAKAPLIRMLGDFSIPARWEMVDLLGQCYGEAIAASLARAAKDADPEIRDHVVGALARMDGPDSLDLLRRIAAEDTDQFVKEQALEALEKRCGDEDHSAEPETPPVVTTEPRIPKPAPAPSSGLSPAPGLAPQYGSSPLDAPASRPPSGLTPPATGAPPPPPKPTKLRPLFGSAPPAPSAPGGAPEPPERIVERSLEAMGASWRLEDNTYVAEVPLDDASETASILTGRVDAEDAPILQLSVVCGPAQGGAYEAALRNNNDMVYGALAVVDIDGQPYFVLTDTMPASPANADAIRKTLTALAQAACDLRG